ncbi:DUF2325 domain-containing protein [Abyssisolibacter fermentans]|uniref:DUF2325 domain-containing protein n=1 Tax=Abyssisolibacter fermentans TaxID=1766203 RepID=UPI000831B958|nr:DUF2325 domain-containing protein [Abyssisolibacter fermentans]
MTALIVGGDKLGNIPQVLNNKGVDDFIHWTGRKKLMYNKEIPSNIDMVIVFYDFINHNTAGAIKKMTKNLEIPCIYSKRACSDLAKKMDNCRNCKHKNMFTT